MTKKEYLSILNQIALNYDAEYVNECHDDFCVSMRNNIKQLENLIKEHFDNPPLFLSDLEDEETYWHMDYGWIRIKNVLSYDCIVISTLTSDGYMRISFEEDMFYRKQVEDE